MNELWLPDESIAEGISAYHEALAKSLPEELLVVEIYLAIDGMKRIVEMRDEHETRH